MGGETWPRKNLHDGNIGVLVGLGRLGVVISRMNHGGVTSDLRHKIKKVTVGVRTIGGETLVTIVEPSHRSVQALDGVLGKVEVGRTSGGVLLLKTQGIRELTMPWIIIESEIVL